jgi:dihydroorotate dehydrogenase (fumarate)
MADLSCLFLGLELKNPFIIADISVDFDLKCLKEYEKLGASAIILKPLCEERIVAENEEIRFEEGKLLGITQEANNYLNIIKEAKKELSIPVFASINCISANNWLEFLPYIEKAGADALELNIFMYPLDKDFRSDDYENIYFDIVTKSLLDIKIPVSLKIGPYFTNLLNIVDQVFYRGITCVELFNRYYHPDIDLDELEIMVSDVVENTSDFNHTLHWIAILSSRINKIEILASTHINDGNSVIKLLLSGANAVVLNSSIEAFRNNLPKLLFEVSEWMDQKGFEKIEHIQGQINYEHIKDTSNFIRSEILRMYS